MDARRQLMACPPSGISSMERVRYFARQLITPDDLTAEQEYFRNKLRRHNRLLHGWGVVCGGIVRPIPKSGNSGNEPWMVRITPGYALGPYGDEIFIDREVAVDLRKEGLDGLATAPCADQLDPWCSEVEVERGAGEPLYVAVKYTECKSRPVRVHVGCSCDETHCEYSRIRDSFTVKVLTQCLESHRRGPASMAIPSSPSPIRSLEFQRRAPEPLQFPLAGFMGGPIPDCPDCPSEPWVMLAKVVPGMNGEISESSISNCDFGEGCYRRMFVAFGDFWWHCAEPPAPTPTPTPTPPPMF